MKRCTGGDAVLQRRDVVADECGTGPQHASCHTGVLARRLRNRVLHAAHHRIVHADPDERSRLAGPGVQDRHQGGGVTPDAGGDPARLPQQLLAIADANDRRVDARQHLQGTRQAHDPRLLPLTLGDVAVGAAVTRDSSGRIEECERMPLEPADLAIAVSPLRR